MKGVKWFTKYQKLFIILALLLVPFFILLNTNNVFAATTSAPASRFLYAYRLSYGTDMQWSEPQRYNQYQSVTFQYLYGTQINTYPNAAPVGQYVNVSGKLNISILNNDTGALAGYPWFREESLNRMSVVCGWGGTTLVTDSYSINYSLGKWNGDIEGVMNNAYVAYADISFNWTGHFDTDYQNVQSGSLLSCAVRNYDSAIALGNLNNYYVYASDAGFDSYLSVETSNDSSINAINATTNAVNDVNNTLKEQQQQDQQDRDDFQNQSDDSQSDADAAAASVTNASTSLLTIIGNFVNIIIHPPASDCKIDGNMGNMDLGEIDLCYLSLPPAFAVIGSLLIIGFTIPFAYSLIMTFLSLLKGATEG